MKEKQFFQKYSIIELKRCVLYEYYLSKKGYGDLMHLYSTKEEFFPTQEIALQYIQIANDRKFWND